MCAMAFFLLFCEEQLYWIGLMPGRKLCYLCEGGVLPSGHSCEIVIVGNERKTTLTKLIEAGSTLPYSTMLQLSLGL